jgi:hypothetical protein
MLEITALLRSWAGGNRNALNSLMPVVYDELCRVARFRMMGERPDHTLNPTALVNEVYLRLIDIHTVLWQDVFIN